MISGFFGEEVADFCQELFLGGGFRGGGGRFFFVHEFVHGADKNEE